MSEFGALQMEITGTVVDRSTGEPLPQANVYSTDEVGKQTGGGCAADINGKFKLTAFAGSFITASYTGYNKQIKPAATTLNYRLEPGANLKEVEIIGYVMNYKLWIALGICAMVLAMVWIYKRYVK